MDAKKARPDVKVVVGENLRRLIASRERDGVEGACVRLGMKMTQVKRIMAGKHAVTMSTVERIASAYDIAAYQLLVPNLDPTNPQVLRELTPKETLLYKVLEETLAAAKKSGTQ